MRRWKSPGLVRERSGLERPTVAGTIFRVGRRGTGKALAEDNTAPIVQKVIIQEATPGTIGAPRRVMSVKAENRVVSPAPVNAPVLGDTVTLVGTCATMRTAVLLTPSVVAVIVEDPMLTAVTRPAEFTVATAVLLEAQVKDFPEMVAPAASLALA